jgi:hypothetical protein
VRAGPPEPSTMVPARINRSYIAMLSDVKT